MILTLLLACTGARPTDTADTSDTSAGDTSGTADVPCTPWLPWDVPGATWAYADADGALTVTYTAEGPVVWDYGVHASLAIRYWQDGTSVHAGRTFFACTAEGLAMVGSDTANDGLRYVTLIEPPALWMPRDPAVGDTWGAASEAAMDVYDADGVLLDRDGAPLEYTMSAVGTEEVVAPAGTFATLLVDFEGTVQAHADGVGLVRIAQGTSTALLAAYDVP
ncbi:MAG: hypothetical protein ACK4YP_20760 [Myxococcota bacterium]